MMEYWNVGRLGLKSGKRSILKKMLYLHFMMMLVRPPISTFSQKTRHSREKINTIIIVLILNVHHSNFPKPNIPVFHHSNCERSELCSIGFRCRVSGVMFRHLMFSFPDTRHLKPEH